MNHDTDVPSSFLVAQFSGQSTIEREWDTYNPILSATDPTLSCNDAGTSLASGQLSATVAGTALIFLCII